MKVLIAPDKFKGSLSAREVAENIALGLRDVLPGAKIGIVPMADGGEGTAEVVCDALSGKWVNCRVRDPLGRQIEARYAWIANCKLAVMEMSEAAGMRRVAENERDPLPANTFGVGEMLLGAAQHGAEEIIIGLGGSATNDGGFGMARALGFRFFSEKEQELTGGVGELMKLARIEKPKDLSLPKIVAAADVRNPLLGENGATHVFGPQKGANASKIDILERALTTLADVVSKDLDADYRNKSGAGAAGGLGFGLMSFCGAKIRPGFDVVAESIRLESKMKGADVVITGEGSLDRQTLAGKTPAGVARLARKLRKLVFAIVGRASEDRQVREIFDDVYVLAQPGMSEKENMTRAAEFLRVKARDLASTLNRTSNVERRTPNVQRRKMK
jgi:glycerate kinase